MDLFKGKVDLKALEGEVSVLKTDVSILKIDVSILKTDVSVLKADVSVLKTDVSILKADVSVLKTDVIILNKAVIAVQAQVDEIDSAIVNLRADAMDKSSLNPMSLGAISARFDEMFRGIGRSFERSCRGLAMRLLRERGFSNVVTQEGEGRRIESPKGIPGGGEIDFLSLEPFACGEFTFYLKDVKKIEKFISKIEQVQKKTGLTSKPLLIFIAFRVKREVFEEAAKLLNAANCIWHIGGKTSRCK